MRIVNGWICVARKGKEAFLFGRRVNQPLKSEEETLWEPLQTNGIKPFESSGKARAVKRELTLRSLYNEIRTKKIELEIGETPEEIMSFSGRKSLIVIVQNEEGLEFLGQPTAFSRAHLLPGANLTSNDLKPFRYFSDGIHAIRKLNEAGTRPVFLSTFSLS